MENGSDGSQLLRSGSRWGVLTGSSSPNSAAEKASAGLTKVPEHVRRMVEYRRGNLTGAVLDREESTSSKRKDRARSKRAPGDDGESKPPNPKL